MTPKRYLSSSMGDKWKKFFLAGGRGQGWVCRAFCGSRGNFAKIGLTENSDLSDTLKMSHWQAGSRYNFSDIAICISLKIRRFFSMVDICRQATTRHLLRWTAMCKRVRSQRLTSRILKMSLQQRWEDGDNDFENGFDCESDHSFRKLEESNKTWDWLKNLQM